MLDLEVEDLEELSKKDKVVSKYMERLEEVNQNPEFREYMSMEEDAIKMENSHISEGIRKGLEEGLEKGILSEMVLIFLLLLIQQDYQKMK